MKKTSDTNKMRALFLDKASLYPQDLDFSALQEVASWQWFDNANPGDIQHSLEDAEILVTNKVLISSEVVDLCQQLKLICVAATGVNNVDLAAAKNRGITVCNVRAYATSSVVQHVFSLMLALNRKLFSYKRSAVNGDWSRSDFFCYFGQPISELAGKKIGIIGYGELGRAVAKVASGFGMDVLIARSHNAGHNTEDAADVQQERVDLKTLLAACDVVSLHCPLTSDNYHMIGEKELALMKTDALLINTARGGLIDEPALLQALQNREIAAAALDVLEEEPPSVSNALINYREDNLIITPHIAWASRESRQRMVNEIAKNIVAYQQGDLRNVV
jgi:glycerate dehydrogenase